MQFLKTLTLLALLVLTACASEKKENRPIAPPVIPSANTQVDNPTRPQTPAPTNTSNVEHYICPDGHVGSGGPAAGSCAQCGVALVHNQAFHANDAAPATPNITTTPSGTIPPAPGAAQSPVFNTSTPAVTPPTPPEPPQNAAGVWHYTCPDGHAGGAGGASNCAQCGKALVHNQAYHN